MIEIVWNVTCGVGRCIVNEMEQMTRLCLRLTFGEFAPLNKRVNIWSLYDIM